MASAGNPPYSAFGISEFISRVGAKGDFAKRNRYHVEVTPPTSITAADGSDEIDPANIEFLVKTVSFPSRTFGTTNFRYGGKYAMEVPYETTTEGISITFLETDKWQCRKFWYNWLEHIQNTRGYNMQYYDKYKGSINISVYDGTQREATQPKHKVELVDAWPKGMSAIELGWENSELLDFTVDIVYKKWELHN